MNGLKSYYLKLTTLTPVHIGTGESYEPTNFVIDSGKLYEFDEVLFYRGLSDMDKRDFDSKLSDWMAIIGFYKKHTRYAKELAEFECAVTQSVESKYKTVTNKDGTRNENQFEIHKTYKNPNTHRAIIPGSSIKGMLDTILGIYSSPEVASNEQRQALVVSDALLMEGGVEIGYSYRVHKNPSKAEKNRIPQIVEVIKPGSSFILQLKSKFNFDTIKTKVETYIGQREERPQGAHTYRNSFLARIGKYSGKPFMVYHIRDGKNSFGKPVATHTLYEKGNMPFGWVKFELIDETGYIGYLASIEAEEKSAYEAIKQRQAQVREKIEQDRKERLKREAEKRRAEEQRLRELAEQKEKEEAKLQKMTPVEALIYKLEKEKNNPNETIDITIYNALKEGKFDSIEEGRCQALAILKSKMIELKKWVESSKKPQKDKKYKRTQEVMAMLDECKDG